MRVHHLNCATFCPYSPRLVGGAGSLFGAARLVCHCLLVESSDGLVLVDTGLGREDLARPRERLSRSFLASSRPRLDPGEPAIAQVERLGFSAHDVRHVVLTHGDLDHAGGLSDFPAAQVHLYAEEHDAVVHPKGAERIRYRPIQWAHRPKLVSHPVAGDRWEGFDAVRALPGAADEVLLVPLVGHTRGHAGVAVRSEQGWLLHAGDAYFFHGQMDPERPHIPPGLGLFQRLVDTDSARRKANQERLRQLVKARGAEVAVFCAHDPVELERSLARADLGSEGAC